MLTKSEFLSFLACEKDAWLGRHRPDAFERPPPGDFDRLLIADGYAVENVARSMFASRPDCADFAFQVEITDGRCLARADIVRTLPDGRIGIFEVKSSSSAKDHIADACFQRIVAERAGYSVAGSFVVHVSKDYRRKGELDPSAILLSVPVDDEIAAMRVEIEAGIDRALAIMAQQEIDETGCGCLLKSRAQRCAAFEYLNPDIPHPSAHVLPRMGGKRLATLVEEGRLAIKDVTATDVTSAQAPILEALQSGEPIIDRAALRTFLQRLAFPLYFYDYETAGAAIPMADGHGPHEQIPTQFSCHILHADGNLTHTEFLAEGYGDEGALVTALRAAIGPEGSLIVWNESFEKACNTRMARLLPSEAPFLEDLNRRTVDLMVPFQKHFVHPGFVGSTSIKKVLPVLCPHLSYEGMAVSDGTAAILAFREMADTKDSSQRKALRRHLLDYCRLDSLAMVEIYRVVADAAREVSGH